MESNTEKAKSHFYTSSQISSYLYEPFYNLASLNYHTLGNTEASLISLKKSLECFPGHHVSKNMLEQITVSLI
jgi:hypothetical protein